MEIYLAIANQAENRKDRGLDSGIIFNIIILDVSEKLKKKTD